MSEFISEDFTMETEYRGIMRPATDEDKNEIIRLQGIPLPGQVMDIRFTGTKPFIAMQAGNTESNPLVLEENGSVIGMGNQASRRLFVNGSPERVGFLNSLRTDPDARKNRLSILADGFRYLREISEERDIPYYLQTILTDNARALHALTSESAHDKGIPTAELLGRNIVYLTYLNPNVFRGLRGVTPLPGVSIDYADKSRTEEIAALINRYNKQYQFSHVYTAQDLAGETNLLPDFDINNSLVAIKDGQIIGFIGIWDQSAFKEYSIVRYKGTLGNSTYRKLINGTYGALTGERLHQIDEPVHTLHASMVASNDNNPAVFNLLAYNAIRESIGKAAYLSFGFDARHPFANGSIVSNRYTSRKMASNVYAVYWGNRPDSIPSTQNCLINLENATL